MSWLARLFGSRTRELTALDIVSQYGSVLETGQRGFSGVLDVADLPFDKTQIKSAILEVAADFKDNPEQIRVLGMGFAMLGSFQPLSNAPMQMPRAQDVAKMNDEELKRFAESMAGRSDDDSNLRKSSIAETIKLEAEWESYLASLGITNA